MQNTASITENHRFKTIYHRGKSTVRKTMAVYVLRNRQNGENRLGITVSAKLGGAVERNRMRRRLKEAYRLNESRLKPGFDIILVARRASFDMHFSVIEQELLSALKELSVI